MTLCKSQPRNRRGFSLLEVTIGAFMTSLLAVMAAGVAVDISRHTAANIRETQIAGEARLAIENFRRDFSGSCPDVFTGDQAQWRLVGRMIPNKQELRLCFDADRDVSADWIPPDRVITYTLQGTNLVRTDQLSGNTFTVARHVEDIKFKHGGNKIKVEIDFELADAFRSYTFVTADVQ